MILSSLDCYIARLDEKKKNKNQANNITIQQYNNVFVLVDYYHVPYLRGIGKTGQLGIEHGDQKSISIASASILAKVHRDKIMESLNKQFKYKKYGWGRNKQSLFRAKGRDIYGLARNKGYGTSEHQKAILRYGLTRYHRKEFVKTFLEKKKEK